MKNKDEIWSMAIDVAIFRAEVVTLITNSKEYLMEEIKNVLNDDLKMKTEYAEDFSEALKDSLEDEEPFPLGLTYEIECFDGRKDVFVILNGTPKTVSRGTVIHEMYHAMKKICNNRGVKDEETEAYMLEYLCSEIFKQMESFNKTHKKG